MFLIDGFRGGDRDRENLVVIVEGYVFFAFGSILDLRHECRLSILKAVIPFAKDSKYQV